MSTANFPDHLQGVEIDWYAEGDVVNVIPRDRKRFEIEKDKAIDLLQVADRGGKQIEYLVQRLGEWIQTNNKAIFGAYLTLQDGAFAFVVVRKIAEYDEKFQDSLADLDFEIANDSSLDLIKLKTLALPNVDLTSLRSFLDQRLVISFHGKRSRSRKSGEQEP